MDDRASRSQHVRGLALIFLVSIAAVGTAHGQVPSATDVGACNDEAPRVVRTGAASPIAGDHARAKVARTDTTRANTGNVTGSLIESSDPQIHGMSAEGAKDATYQAAYRSCMRRKGF